MAISDFFLRPGIDCKSYFPFIILYREVTSFSRSIKKSFYNTHVIIYDINRLSLVTSANT